MKSSVFDEVRHYKPYEQREDIPFVLRWKRNLFFALYTYKRGRSSFHHRLNHTRNNDRFLKLINQKRVLIIGSGPSAPDIGESVDDIIVMTCNLGVKLLFDKGIRRCDLLLLNGKMVESIIDLEDTREFFKLFDIRNLIIPSQKYLKDIIESLDIDEKRIIVDDIWDNYYLERLITPIKFSDIVGNAVHLLSSSGVRLLQYALYFGAHEIYTAGLDLDTRGYFFKAMPYPPIHCDIDHNIMKIVSKKSDNIYSATLSSPITKYFPYKKLC